MLAAEEMVGRKLSSEGKKFRRLGDAAKYLNGRAFKPTEWKKEGLPIVRIQNLNDHNAEFNYTSQTFDDRFLLKNGDLVFAWSASLGAYIWNRGGAWLNQHIFKVVPNEGVNKMYLYYAITNVVAELYAKTHGSGMVHVTKGKFEETEIYLPALPEQNRIVEKIEELFSELDNAVATLKSTRQQLQTYRASVLKYAFEGYFTKGGKWNYERIGNILDTINNGYTPSASKMTSTGDVQFLKVYNLNFDGTLNYTKNPVFISREVHEKELKRSRTYPGDVIINIVGPPLGKVSIVPPIAAEFNINQAMVVFHPNERVKTKFLSYYLQSPEIIQWLKNTSQATAGQYNIKVSTCREIPFPVLEIKSQERVIEEIETRLSESDYLLQTVNEQLAKAESLRQSILQKAFSGEL